MKPRIGLYGPFFVLVCFALLYNPFFIPYLPKKGLGAALTSPQTFFFVSSVILILYRRLRLQEVGLKKQLLMRHVGWGIALGLSPAILTILLGGLAMGVDQLYPFLPYPLLGGAPLSIHFDTTTIIILIIMAPITEELFFRGILLKGLREYYSAAPAVVLSAILFMGGHGGFAIGPLLMGLITAPITLATGSIVPGIIFHAFANGYGPIMVEYFPNLYRYLQVFYQ